jgi:hypothetical protein
MSTNPLIITGPPTPLQPVVFEPVFETGIIRTVAVINGQAYRCIKASVDDNAHGATGSATVSLSLLDNPDFTVQLFRGTPDASAGQLPIENDAPVYVQLYFGFESGIATPPTDVSQLTLRFYGIVDTYAVRFHEGIVDFTCRSLAAPLVDNRVTGVTMNETTTQFVTRAAAMAGLTPVIVLEDASLTMQEVLAASFIGGFNFNSALYGMRWWDLILRAALFDGADAWVYLDKLYYAAIKVTDSGNDTTIPRNTVALRWGRDFTIDDGLVGTHSPQFNKNVQVEVHTYQRRTRWTTGSRVKMRDGITTIQQQSREASSSPNFGTPSITTTTINSDGTSSTSTSTLAGGNFSATTGAGTETGKERYVFFVRNISPERANALAQSLCRQISQHEYQLDGEIALTKSALANVTIMSWLDVQGCPYRYFNSPRYYPRKLTLSVDLDQGARMRFQAVNHALPSGAV